jgi:hypothetical protein
MVLVALSPTVTFAQVQGEVNEQMLPPAEQLLDAMVEASGGVEAYAAINTVVSKGSIEFSGIGIGAEIAIYQARPGLLRSEFIAEGLGLFAQGTNGEVSWEVSNLQGPRLLTGDEKAFFERTSVFDANIIWREHFTSAETVGTEELGDATCFLVKLTPKQGNPETWWIDQSSKLVVKAELKLKIPMGEFPVEVTFDDYREVGGITMPYRFSQKVIGQEVVTALDEIEINTELDPSVFDLPQEIVDLLDRDKEQQKKLPAEAPGD